VALRTRSVRPAMALRVVPAVLACLATASLASAQATRTWVSGVGDDANPCSRTAPCKTWAGAISKTAAGGEIDALDPGGFGAVTITKSVTLDGGGGQVASVLVAATNGIVVAAQPTDVVILRNLRVNGLGGSGTPGLNGILFLSGKRFHVEHCVIFGFPQLAIGVEPSGGAAGQLFVSDTEMANNGTGILLKRGTSATGTIAATIERSCMDGNATGLDAEDYSVATMLDGFVSANSTTGVLSTAANGTSEINLEGCIVAGNGVGVQANANGTVRLSETMVTSNTTGLQESGTPAGTIISYGNIQIAGNTTNGAPTSTVPQQ